MDRPERTIHSFIVKIWLQTPATRAAPATWSGQITHVPGGERRYLRNLNGVTAFIAPYLAAMGVNPGIRGRAKSWLSRLK